MVSMTDLSTGCIFDRPDLGNITFSKSGWKANISWRGHCSSDSSLPYHYDQQVPCLLLLNVTQDFLVC